MHSLTNDEIIEAYIQAIALQLEPEFIALLEKELACRKRKKERMYQPHINERMKQFNSNKQVFETENNTILYQLNRHPTHRMLRS